MKQWNTVEVLKHNRHDWLNKVQLIKGYLDLNRVDEVNRIVDDVIIEARNHSNLDRLNLPLFSQILFTHNWNATSFSLEFDVEDDVTLHVDDEHLTLWTSSFFETIAESIEPFSKNHLSVTINSCEEGNCLYFDFSGTIVKKQTIKDFCKMSYFQKNLNVLDIKEDEFTICLIINDNEA